MYLLLALLGVRGCLRASPFGASGGHRACELRPPLAVASLPAAPGLWGTWTQDLWLLGLGCPRRLVRGLP